jgi:hypothetical protein
MYSEAVLVIPHRGVVIPSGAASAGTDASIVGAQAGLSKRLGSILEVSRGRTISRRSHDGVDSAK